MGDVRVVRMKHITKVTLSYSHARSSRLKFVSFNPMKHNLVVNVFLENGKRINADEIKSVSLKHLDDV